MNLIGSREHELPFTKVECFIYISKHQFWINILSMEGQKIAQISLKISKKLKMTRERVILVSRPFTVTLNVIDRGLSCCAVVSGLLCCVRR